MNTDEVVSFLRSTELLGGMHDAALEAAARQMDALDVDAGTVLFEEGSPGDTAYLVLTGELALVAHGVELIRRGPGSVIGEFALIDDKPRSAAAVARSACRLLAWQRAEFLASLASDPLMARGILRVLTRKLRGDVVVGVDLRMEQARREHELSRAREIQSAMLPAEQVRAARLTVAGHCAPVGAMGGDFYDVLPFRDGRTAVLIADVTGMGLYASLVVAMVKSALHAQARHDPEPAAMMATMSRTLALSRDWTTMMSCAYLLFDPGAGRVSYGNAGHPYPLHWSAGVGCVSRMEALDVILGVQEPDEVRYQVRTMPWAPGDLLLLYSDGITEARATSDEMFGRARLERTLGATAHRSAVEVRDAVLDAVKSHAAGGPRGDDATLVVMRAQ